MAMNRNATPTIEYLGPKREIPRCRWIWTRLTQDQGHRKQKSQWRTTLQPSRMIKQLTEIIVIKTLNVRLQFTRKRIWKKRTLNLELKTHLSKASIESFNRCDFGHHRKNIPKQKPSIRGQTWEVLQRSRSSFSNGILHIRLPQNFNGNSRMRYQKLQNDSLQWQHISFRVSENVVTS